MKNVLILTNQSGFLWKFELENVLILQSLGKDDTQDISFTVPRSSADEAMEILEGMKVAEGIINKTQAIEIAEKNVTVKYDQVRADFDTEKGMWTVSFSQKLAAGGDQTFTLTYEGKIIDVVFGE